MQSCFLQQVRLRQRSGVTLIELIVVISVLATLAAVILPSVRRTGGYSRRVHCLSNLRNVGLAMHAYATTQRGELPPLTGGFEILNLTPTKASWRREVPWSVILLPYLEQTTLYDRIKVPSDRALLPVDELHELAQSTIEEYRCPSAKTPHAGGLSYVANAGIIAADRWAAAGNASAHDAANYDFGFNGYGAENQNVDDAEAAYSTGVFWHVPMKGIAEGHPRPVTLDEISAHDGTSQTVLLAENLNTRSYDPTTRTGGWISSSLGDIAFGIAVPGQRLGAEFRVDLSSTASGLGEAGGAKETSLKLSQSPVSPASRINSNLAGAVNGSSPRPSALHPGAVNMAFADGSCKMISEQIDPSVYARLLSPRGGMSGQKLLSDTEF